MYFSLVVRADESQPIPDTRMFEDTSRQIASNFIRDKRPDLISLSRYPVILTKEFQEGDASTEAIIGYMDEPSMNPRISRPVLRFPAKALVDRGILSGRWPGSRTQWLVFEGDPYRMLAGVETREVAGKETAVVNERQVAVMMPFRDDASIDPVFKVMRQGVEDAGFQCVRVDQLLVPGDITEDIRRLIGNSQIVIADLSGVNPNVMYELGFAQGCGKKTILVSSDSPENLPFDIRSQRVLPYQRSKAGLDELESKISNALRAIV